MAGRLCLFIIDYFSFHLLFMSYIDFNAVEGKDTLSTNILYVKEYDGSLGLSSSACLIFRILHFYI